MVITNLPFSSHRSSKYDAPLHVKSSVYSRQKQTFSLAQVSFFLMGVSPH